MQFALTIKPTNRGFLRAEFLDRDGIPCSIQESSIATEDLLWLGCDQGQHHHVTGACMARMHLTREMACSLAQALSRFYRRGSLAELSPVEQAANLQKLLKESEEMDIQEIREMRLQIRQVTHERDTLLMMILDESEFGEDVFKRAVEKLRRRDQITATGFESDFRQALVEDTCFETEMTEGDIDRIISIAGASFENVWR